MLHFERKRLDAFKEMILTSGKSFLKGVLFMPDSQAAITNKRTGGNPRRKPGGRGGNGSKGEGGQRGEVSFREGRREESTKGRKCERV